MGFYFGRKTQSARVLALMVALMGLAPQVLSHGESEAVYRYDAAGRLVSANYGESTIYYEYDAIGNITSREVRDAGIQGVGEVSEAGTVPANVEVTAGDNNVALASFGLRNDSANSVDLSQVSVNLLGEGILSLSELRLILDANENQQSDVGEVVLSTESMIALSGAVMFSLPSDIILDAGETLSFVVVANF